MSNLDSKTSFVRGFMFDSARCQENRAYYRRAIDFAAERGMTVLLWHFSDDQGCSIQFDADPQIASPGAYSKTEMRELIAYAKKKGIEIVPELASLGHCRYLTRLPAYQHLNETESYFTGMCPVSTQTREMIQSLLEETLDIFDSPNFHVGMDEVNIGDHPLTKAALQTQTRADLLSDYIGFLHGVISSAGRRMWMWGDMILKYPQMLETVSKDIVICNWQYEPQAMPGTTQTLLDAGFDIILCSALISHDQPLFPGDRFALSNVRSLKAHEQLRGCGRVLGHLNTIWTPVRFLADSMWIGIDLAAALLRSDADVSNTDQAAIFAREFYGLDEQNSEQFARAAALLFQHVPLREEWLAVVKLAPLSATPQNRITTAAVAFESAKKILHGMENAVLQNEVQFQAYLLMVQMLANSYWVATSVLRDETHEWANCIARSQDILNRVDRNWNRERSASDPRKFRASHVHFQDDHLIPLLQTGLTRLKTKLEESAVAKILDKTSPGVRRDKSFAV